jgi:hypothetical protein
MIHLGPVAVAVISEPEENNKASIPWLWFDLKEHDHQALQKDLKNLEEWANKWGMRFNAKKCYTLSINKSSTRFYELNSHTLQEVSDNPYLKWSIHINKVCKKANATLGFFDEGYSFVSFLICQCRIVPLEIWVPDRCSILHNWSN